MQARIQDHWMTEGVTIVDPRNTYIDGRATIGRDTVIYPVHGDLRAMSRSAADCRVGPFAHLRDGHGAGGRRRGRGLRRGQAISPRDRARSPGTSPTWATPRSAATSTSAPGPSRPTSTAVARTRPRSATRRGIGSGAVMVAPVTIGQDAVVGAGAVITRGTRIEDGDTVVGVPAHVRSRQSRTSR